MGVKKNKKSPNQEEKTCPSCDHLDFWLLQLLGERQGEEKGED